MEVVELVKDDLTLDLFKNVAFLKFAEGGAMGEPGGVEFITTENKAYHFNYCYRDITYDDFLSVFPTLKKCRFGMFGIDSSTPKGWKYVNLGMGNHLIVASIVYDEFAEKIKNFDNPGKIYANWFDIASKMLMKL